MARSSAILLQVDHLPAMLASDGRATQPRRVLRSAVLPILVAVVVAIHRSIASVAIIVLIVIRSAALLLPIGGRIPVAASAPVAVRRVRRDAVMLFDIGRKVSGRDRRGKDCAEGHRKS
jgi:hypothetical protein